MLVAKRYCNQLMETCWSSKSNANPDLRYTTKSTLGRKVCPFQQD